MKKRKKMLTWLITLLFLVITGWYALVIIWSVRQDGSIPVLIKGGLAGIIVLILLPIMIMMVVTALRRRKEIDEEDEDDLSQY